MTGFEVTTINMAHRSEAYGEIRSIMKSEKTYNKNINKNLKRSTS